MTENKNIQHYFHSTCCYWNPLVKSIRRFIYLLKEKNVRTPHDVHCIKVQQRQMFWLWTFSSVIDNTSLMRKIKLAVQMVVMRQL